MKFLLFSKVTFEVPDPIPLIECYCYQSDFYAKFDLLSERKVEDVNKIGARIESKLLSCPKFKAVIENAKNLRLFKCKYDLDSFLQLDKKTRENHVRELDEKVLKKLIQFERVGLARATKVLHTLYPKIIPMIDNPLQKLYREKIDSQWTERQSDKILIDYYDNFKKGDNWQNLTGIFNQIPKNLRLTKVRIFDIIWWSYLKSKKLGNINWSTIK